MISVAFLIILFSVQKYGTSKVGLAVGPALFIWFCTLAGLGIYNLVVYDRSVLKAFNPVHIYYFFKRNSTNAWYCLGGCILCATGKHTSIEFFFLVVVERSDNFINIVKRYNQNYKIPLSPQRIFTPKENQFQLVIITWVSNCENNLRGNIKQGEQI